MLYSNLAMIRVFFVPVAVAFFSLAVAGEENEKDWKQHVISAKERSFDFKTVAKGTIPEYQFVLKNPLQEPMHIGAITSSCTCTDLRFDAAKTVLKTYDEFFLTVRLRGDQYEGQRNAAITVVIDKPVSTELQLNIRGEIRTDLSVSPKNFLDFGNIELEKGKTSPLTLTYTGSNTQWRLVDAKCENEFIRTEITSEYLVGKKIFTVNVSVDKSAPHGTINTLLTLISNDTESRREIPIPLRATVGTVVRISPPSLFLGVLPPGEVSPRKEALLLGTKPFRIMKIECGNPAIEILLTINNEEPPKTLYRLPIVYKNPVEGEGAPQGGVMRTAVRVTTDVPGITPMFYVTSSVPKNEEEN